MELVPEIHARTFAATHFPRLGQLIRVVLGPVGLRYDKALVYSDPESWDLLVALASARTDAIVARDADRAIESVRSNRARLHQRTMSRLTEPTIARYFREL